MKNAPYKMAFLGLSITILRIAMLVAIIDSGFGPMLGKFFAGAFAIFLAGSTYVSSYFVRHQKTRAAGAVGLAVFGIADLWFNEATVVYYTSAASLVGPESTFLGIDAGRIREFMQWTALGFGFLPTLGSAVLGWMQAGAGEVTALNRPGIAARIGTALSKLVVSWAAGFAIKLESQAKVSEKDDWKDRVKYDWRLLSVSERRNLPATPDEIRKLYPGMEVKTSENWAKRRKLLDVSER